MHVQKQNKLKKGQQNPIQQKENMVQKQICIIQELYGRSFDYDKKRGKRWILSPAESVLVNIENFPEKIKKTKK
jgi:hypothetical protein